MNVYYIHDLCILHDVFHLTSKFFFFFLTLCLGLEVNETLSPPFILFCSVIVLFSVSLS